MIMTSTLKKLLDVALVIGLISHVRDHYSGKKIIADLDKATKIMEDIALLIPEGLTDKQVSKAEKKILSLEKWLKNKRTRIYTAVAMGLLSDMLAFSQKTPLISQKIKEAEIILYRVHKYLDRNLDNYDEYKEASKIISYWEELK